MNSKSPTIDIALSSARRIDAAELTELYASEPWWPERQREDVAEMLLTNTAVGAWDGDQLVGFARVVTDGRFRAYIEDVLVLKSYRNTGIGRKLMAEILNAVQDIHVVTLFCQKKLVNYYAELGFKEFTKQVVMHLRNVR